MSIQYMDNFSIFGTDEAAVIAGTPWSTLSSSFLADDPDGVSGGKVLRISSGVSSQPSFVLPTATDVVRIAFRWWCSALPVSSAEGHDIEIRDANNFVRYVFHIEPNGAITLTRTDGAGVRIDAGDVSGFTDLVTSANVLSSGQWQHIEIFFDRTTGDYELRVEGATVIMGTDPGPIATGDTAIIAWRTEWIASASANQTPYIKDLIIADDNGSVNTGFIGTCQVITLVVDGDVSSGWTPSSGTSDFALLDETTPDDAGYIEAEDDPLPAASIMTFDNLPADIVGVRALQTMVRAFKTDGGDGSLQVSLISNAAEDAGLSHPLATNASYEWDISELDPDTAALWTPVAVDAATIKLDRVI